MYSFTTSKEIVNNKMYSHFLWIPEIAYLTKGGTLNEWIAIQLRNIHLNLSTKLTEPFFIYSNIIIC